MRISDWSSDVCSSDLSDIKTKEDLDKYLDYIKSNDSNIIGLNITEKEIILYYQKKTNILWIIPKKYPLEVQIDIDQSKYAKDRVEVQYPWYASVFGHPDKSKISEQITKENDLNDVNLPKSPDKIAKVVSTATLSIKN